MFFWIFAPALCLCLIHNLVESVQVTDLCPPQLPRDQYIQTRGDSCYQFVFFRKLTRSAAEADCESHGGWLVQIKNQDTQNYLHNQVLNRFHYPGKKLWIGLSHLPGQNDFAWVDGEEPNYTHWAPGEGIVSSQDTGHAECAILDMSEGGMWRALPCDSDPLFSAPQPEETHLYICEYSLHPTTTAGVVVVTHVTRTDSPGLTTPGPLGSDTSLTLSCPLQLCNLDCGNGGFKLDATTGCSLCACAA
ncbi:hypothetical protein Btru_046827 [Bulinus truncatus]|nr:hypothetical protein Btru_046827 [Bulinus truncatus]